MGGHSRGRNQCSRAQFSLVSKEFWSQEETCWTGCVSILLGKMSRGPSEAEGFLPHNAVRMGEGMKGPLHRRPMAMISVGQCKAKG